MPNLWAEQRVRLDTDMDTLQQRLAAEQALAVNLRARNAELEAWNAELESQLPAKDLAYEQLKSSLFRLQQLYARSQAQLGTAQLEVQQLRARLAAGKEQGALRGAEQHG
jgi:hypothetical protein